MVSINLPARLPFLPVATCSVEKGAMALGLGEKEALSLTLAAEEIFAYLAGVASNIPSVEIRCTGGGYHVKVDFLFSGPGLDLRLLNLTAAAAVESEEGLREMGLLIASRFVDRLWVEERPGHPLCLTLLKEKAYPEMEYGRVDLPRSLADYAIRRPDVEELKWLVTAAAGIHPPWLVPAWFRFPGKAVDMAGSGEYLALVLAGGRGELGGGIIWHWVADRTVELFGPYIFCTDPSASMAEELYGACIGSVAKTSALGLLVRLPTESLPLGRFEELGSLRVVDRDGRPHAIPAYFRQIHEDPGAGMWCHPAIEPFLRGQYERMVLPRDLRPAGEMGETKHPHSVLYAEFDRPRAAVTLRPVRLGRDIQQNLADHLRLIAGEALPNIFFEVDLGLSWQAPFIPAVLELGFSPRLVLPYAGAGDILVFQWEGGK